MTALPNAGARGTHMDAGSGNRTVGHDCHRVGNLELQRIKFGEVLSTGGARYPLMEHKRDADRLYEVHGKPLYELEALEAAARGAEKALV